MENKVNEACVLSYFAWFGAQAKDENDSCCQQRILKPFTGFQIPLKGNLIS